MLSMRKPYPKLDPSFGNAVISRGTSRTCDLLKAFAEALAEINPNDNDVKYAYSILEQVGEFGWNTELYIALRSEDVPAKDAYELVWDVDRLTYQTLPEKLAELAPVGYAFGLHPTEPQLLGFWPA